MNNCLTGTQSNSRYFYGQIIYEIVIDTPIIIGQLFRIHQKHLEPTIVLTVLI